MTERVTIKPGEEFKQITKRAEYYGGVAYSLWDASKGWLNNGKVLQIMDQLGMDQKSISQMHNLDDFWTKPLIQAVEHLVGKEKCLQIRKNSELWLDGQFSSSMYRRSFRTSKIQYHIKNFIGKICRCLYFASFDCDVCDFLKYDYWDGCGIEYYLAYALSIHDIQAENCVKEAILGENDEILLTTSIIRAVFISGNKEMCDLLCQLLVAARLQEGLRQQILESADSGKLESFIQVIKTCIDADLFRYSSFVRAFGTWSGFAFDVTKPAVVKKYAQFAYDCLISQKLREHYTKSENNMEAYYALWAIGCHESEECDQKVEELLNDPRKYRQILGWYFVSNYDNSTIQMHHACNHLDNEDEEILAWVIQNLSVTWQVFSNYQQGTIANFDLPSQADQRRQLYDKLEKIVERIKNHQPTFKGNPFPFTIITLDISKVINCMMSLAYYDFNPQLCQRLFDILMYMTVSQRSNFYHKLNIQNETERAMLFEGLNDRSVSVKAEVVNLLEKCTLNSLEIMHLFDALKSKSSQLRKSIIDILMNQSYEKISVLLDEMLAADNENQLQAVFELLLHFQSTHAIDLTLLNKLDKTVLSAQTRILYEQLNNCSKVYTRENGYGLYDPSIKYTYEKPKKSRFNIFKKDDLFSLRQMKEYVEGNIHENSRLVDQLNAIFDKHADYEYEILDWQNTRTKVLFGSMNYQKIPLPADADKSKCSFDQLPFLDEFSSVMQSVKNYLSLYLTLASYHFDYYSMNRDVSYQSWFVPYAVKMEHQFYSYYEAYKTRYWQIQSIIMMYKEKWNQKELFDVAFTLYKSLIDFYGEAHLDKNCIMAKKEARFYGNVEKYVINLRALGLIRNLISEMNLDEADFRSWFTYENYLEHQLKCPIYYGLRIEDYLKACEMQLISKDGIYERLLNSQNAASDLRVLTNPKRFPRTRMMLEEHPWLNDVLDEVTSRIAQVEEKRGEAITPLTELANSIGQLKGAKHFADLLAALGNDNFFRGYVYSSNSTKQAVLSKLLKCCYPALEDTPLSLEMYLRQHQIGEKRLVEAVMYAPQWAGFAETITGWNGLKKAVWFFHAHINENFSAEKESEVAVYSPITPQQFNDGAFDKNWFFESYTALGEKRFQILYKSAKYITNGSNQHRRSQLYADASLGKLSIEELEKEICEKRNQEKLRCYPLIPFKENQNKEALKRYEFIQTFLKESRKFGAQRKESEKKACLVAMENLAITMGFNDVTRMMWFLESEKMTQIEPYMKPHEIVPFKVWLEIDENGKAEIAIEKQGKRLKTLPKAMSKDSYVLELKGIVKELKDQHSRAKKSLEQAMIDQSRFSADELNKMLQNPVLYPLLKNLVWTNEAHIGFIAKGQLETLDKHTYPIDCLRIAHPHDLMKAKIWSDMMHKLYDEQIIQPFKQVFREYYPITEDEKAAKNISRRYSGYQVQPQKSIALLKSRGWSVDYEEGLQKVCYGENVIVKMYAMADWFSPADIEPPTLEVIQFIERNNKELLDFENISPILFSEAMRDIDLVVSVAHAGGVDPQASASTIEMRLAIAQELVKLLKLKNVSFIGSHVKIQGSLANYSIHLGSGVVHGEGIGMMNILPVHSQHRGRIFLPFADDDPKTAEIMSKIVLLGEDKKIKDPSILRQIR